MSEHIWSVLIHIILYTCTVLSGYLPSIDTFHWIHRFCIHLTCEGTDRGLHYPCSLIQTRAIDSEDLPCCLNQAARIVKALIRLLTARIMRPWSDCMTASADLSIPLVHILQRHLLSWQGSFKVLIFYFYHFFEIDLEAYIAV